MHAGLFNRCNDAGEAVGCGNLSLFCFVFVFVFPHLHVGLLVGPDVSCLSDSCLQPWLRLVQSAVFFFAAATSRSALNQFCLYKYYGDALSVLAGLSLGTGHRRPFKPGSKRNLSSRRALIPRGFLFHDLPIFFFFSGIGRGK